MAFVCAYLGHQ